MKKINATNRPKTVYTVWALWIIAANLGLIWCANNLLPEGVLRAGEISYYPTSLYWYIMLFFATLLTIVITFILGGIRDLISPQDIVALVEREVVEVCREACKRILSANHTIPPPSLEHAMGSAVRNDLGSGSTAVVKVFHDDDPDGELEIVGNVTTPECHTVTFRLSKKEVESAQR